MHTIVNKEEQLFLHNLISNT